MKTFVVEDFSTKSGKNMCMKAKLNVARVDSTHAQIRLMYWTTIKLTAKNRYCVVEQSGTIKTGNGDSKQASSKIKIKAEIGMAGLFKAGVEWIKEKTNPVPIIAETKDKNDNSSGDSAQIGSSGDYAQIESTGEYSVICCAGNNSGAKAKKGSWITLSEWKYSKEKKRNIPVCVKTEYVDGERIKEDTWYRLVDGEFQEV